MAYEHYYVASQTADDDIVFNAMPNLLYSGIVRDEPDFKQERHQHPFCEIIYVMSGVGDYLIGDKSYHICQKSILVYNEGTPHEELSAPDNPLQTYYFGFDNLKIDGLRKGCLLPEDACPVIAAPTITNTLELYLSNMMMESLSPTQGSGLLRDHLLCCILTLIIRINRTASASEDAPNGYSAITAQTIRYLEENYTSGIRLTDLANRLYVSKDYLTHIFKSDTGTPPIKYIITKRIDTAKNMLVTTDASIIDISQSIGYDNPNYFCQIFKKIVGVSPTTYRSEHARLVKE